MDRETQIRIVSEQLIEYAAGTPEIECYTDLQILLCLVGEIECYVPAEVERLCIKWRHRPEFMAACSLQAQRVIDCVAAMYLHPQDERITKNAQCMVTEATRFEATLDLIEELSGPLTGDMFEVLAFSINALEKLLDPGKVYDALTRHIT